MGDDEHARCAGNAAVVRWMCSRRWGRGSEAVLPGSRKRKLYLLGTGTNGPVLRRAGGRGFVSEDPIRQAGGDPNLYLYVENSPVNRLDPSGHDPIEDIDRAERQREESDRQTLMVGSGFGPSGKKLPPHPYTVGQARTGEKDPQMAITPSANVAATTNRASGTAQAAFAAAAAIVVAPAAVTPQGLALEGILLDYFGAGANQALTGKQTRTILNDSDRELIAGASMGLPEPVVPGGGETAPPGEQAPSGLGTAAPSETPSVRTSGLVVPETPKAIAPAVGPVPTGVSAPTNAPSLNPAVIEVPRPANRHCGGDRGRRGACWRANTSAGHESTTERIES